MKKLLLTLTTLVAFSLTGITTVQAGSMCNNGTYSSNSGRGTCSYNGGINRNFPSFSDPGSSSFNRNNGLSDPWGSLGSTSKKKSRW